MRWLLCLAVLVAACGPPASAQARYERKNTALLDEYSRAGQSSTASSRYGTNSRWGLTTTRTYVMRSPRTPSALADAVDDRVAGREWICSPATSADAAYTGTECLRDTAVLTVGFRVRDARHVAVELSADWNFRADQFNDD